ncbi:MAG: rhodanese-like domain-containing protein [Acidimicrobiales bacterium]|jgi:rhodanese-related sulfurtransferase
MVEVTAGEAASLVESGALLLDVREPAEWEAGHVPGASFIPMNAVAARLGELPSDRRIVVICRSGGRSGVVTEALLGLGFDAVNLVGGMQAWAAENRPVVTEAGTPGTVA